MVFNIDPEKRGFGVIYQPIITRQKPQVNIPVHHGEMDRLKAYRYNGSYEIAMHKL
jgi:hypothetical protein